MSKDDASVPPTMSCTVWLMESHTPAAPSTDHTISTETMVTTPRAIDSRNAVFITDHGSMRVRRRRARRGGRLGRDARAGRFLAGAGAGCGAAWSAAGGGSTGRSSPVGAVGAGAVGAAVEASTAGRTDVESGRSAGRSA